MSNTPHQAGAMPALYAALAKAQGAFQAIVKNRDVEITMKSGGRYRFRYADLEEILSKTRPALAANGLALIQRVESNQGGPLLVCCLVHADGGMLTSEVAMPSARDLGDPKSFGAAITYLRRYLVTAMLGVAADDDLDEDGQEMGEPAARTASKPPVAKPQRRAPADAPAAPAPTAAAGDSAPATQGEIAYISKKIEAKGWTKAEAYQAAGLAFDEALQMTKADFVALKAVL
ncbi:ERF family protein [Quisquiliibacterium transsilvanicum]|uniref:Uncharacterized protein n=1 Tax=Quisquiliibacterium transsilvanicum TaxID=1549638 RepID=A0A7W8HG76_9BURK|nr:ERF family protein [Quisquiliibacterium transsilvanicum]MBB5271519.1 hypothetical protein [Quisquiliibacterium transsilvanicum]